MGSEIMKLIILRDIVPLTTNYKPICGTCHFRGNISVSSRSQNGNVVHEVVTGVKCIHPSMYNQNVEYDHKCGHYAPVNSTLARIFYTKRLI